MGGIILRQRLLSPVGFREVAVVVIETTQLIREHVGPGVHVTVILLTVASADHQVMLTAEQVVAAVGKEIHRVDFPLATVPAGAADIIIARTIAAVRANQHSIGFVDIRINVHRFTVELHFGVGRVQCGLPGVGETLFKRHKDFINFFIVISPVRRGAA